MSFGKEVVIRGLQVVAVCCLVALSLELNLPGTIAPSQPRIACMYSCCAKSEHDKHPTTIYAYNEYTFSQ